MFWCIGMNVCLILAVEKNRYCMAHYAHINFIVKDAIKL